MIGIVRHHALHKPLGALFLSEIGDLPAELLPDQTNAPRATDQQPQAPDWRQALRNWATVQLATACDGVPWDAVAMGEGVPIEAALLATRGNHQLAAKRLGYGRNTLTRKLKTLALPVKSKPQLSLQYRRGSRSCS